MTLSVSRSDAPLVDPLVSVEVAGFLSIEAEALDDRAYDRWLGLVADDFTYRVPIPVLRDNLMDPPFDGGALLIDEDRTSLAEFWFARLQDKMYEIAWGDHPPVRQRRFVTNVRVRAADDGYEVRSNIRLLMIRQATQSGELTAERFDRVLRRDGGLVLASRIAILDQLVLDAPQIRVIL